MAEDGRRHAALARELAAATLAAAGTTSRGRLQAEGILLGADPAQTDAVRARAGEWSRSHDQLALLPGAARRAVADLLGLDAAATGEEPAPVEVPTRTPLTARQEEVVRGIERGLSSTQIAEELGVGTETIRTLTKRLNRRLDVHTRSKAVRAAHERGLVGRR